MNGFSNAMRGIGQPGVQGPTRLSFNPFPESDYLEVLIGSIRKVLPPYSNAQIQKQARALVNAKFANQKLPVPPASREWDDLTKRLAFLRYYVEALLEDGKFSEEELIENIVDLEIHYERDNDAHYRAYQDMTVKAVGKAFRPPDPLPPPPEPEMDEETKAVIRRHQISEKLQAYMQSLSQGPEQSSRAYKILVSAYIETLSDLSIPLMLEFQDQQERAENHPWIEWLQANEFPYQYNKLFPVLDDLLNQARTYLKNNDVTLALDKLDVAQIQFDYLARLLHGYYSEKVRKGSRVVFVLLILKSISRMILSLVVFRNVKGLVSQLGALIAVNLVFQKLDQAAGLRERGLSGGEAVKDAALEILTMKIAGKVGEVLMTRFGVVPGSISSTILNTLTASVISSMQEEFMRLGADVTFVGFLRNLRDKFSSPEFWIETIVVTVLHRAYKTQGTVSLPVNKRVVQGAALTAVLMASPKATANTGANRPVATMSASSTTAVKTPAATPAKPAAKGQASKRPTAKPIAAAATPRAAAIGPKGSALREAVSNQPSRGVSGGIPGQQQRALDNTGVSRSPNSKSNPSPITPLKTLPVLLGAAAVGKRPKRGEILKLFKQAKKLLDRVSDPALKKEIEDRLTALRKAYDKNNDHLETKERLKAVKNTINEKYAEEQITFHVKTNMPFFEISRIVRKIAVPRRGKKGPEILDMVFEVEITNGKTAFLLIESKYGTSRLGWVWYGNVQVRQFSPEWFRMRIAEIRAIDPSFADRLAKAWPAGRILPYVMKITADGAPRAVIDFRKEWNKYGKGKSF